MTGEEFAERRAQLGYTQGALAEVLNTSAPTLSRLEKAREVPAEFAQALMRLEPAAGGGRGPYRAGKHAPRRAAAPPRERAPSPVRRAPAPALPPPQEEQRVYEVEEVGAVEVGALWLAALLLLGIHRHLEERAVGEEVEAAFARLHVRTPYPRPKPQPPPLPRPCRVRPCWRCGSWR